MVWFTLQPNRHCERSRAPHGVQGKANQSAEIVTPAYRRQGSTRLERRSSNIQLPYTSFDTSIDNDGRSE